MPGDILSDLESVEVVEAETIVLHENGKAAVRSWQTTQQAFSCFFRVEGEGVSFSTREIPGDSTQNMHAIRAHITSSGSWLEDYFGNRIAVCDTVVALPTFQRLFVRNDADILSILVGCDTVYHGSVGGNTYEFLGMQSLANSKVTLTSFSIPEIVRDNLTKLPAIEVYEDAGFTP